MCGLGIEGCPLAIYESASRLGEYHGCLLTVLEETTKNGDVLAGRLHLVNAVDKGADVAICLIEGVCDGVKCRVVEDATELLLVRTYIVGIAIEDFSKSVNAVTAKSESVRGLSPNCDD